MAKIIVCGACGRMGTSILRLAAADAAVQVCGAVDVVAAPAAGPAGMPVTDNLASVIAAADVLIDFTTALATLEHLAAARSAGKAIVIGTTGFDAAGIQEISAASRQIPVVFSPNMSVGVNVLFRLVEQAAKAMPGYDIEVVELHHNQKKDAPSGTAMKLAQIAADTRSLDMRSAGRYGREGMPGARTKDEIGVLAVRGGDIVGEHTVYFVGTGERIELTHRAQSRDTLASGALIAAKWVAGKKPGLYTMQDVLGFTRQV
jgi:4-hydroxy-tetrahydrodipicolinate reductase